MFFEKRILLDSWLPYHKNLAIKKKKSQKSGKFEPVFFHGNSFE
jgi:hypothetical protein